MIERYFFAFLHHFHHLIVPMVFVISLAETRGLRQWAAQCPDPSLAATQCRFLHGATGGRTGAEASRE